MADPAPTSWPDVANNTLKFVAAGALLGAIGLFAYWGKVDPQVFTSLCVAALAGIGVHGANQGK